MRTEQPEAAVGLQNINNAGFINPTKRSRQMKKLIKMAAAALTLIGAFSGMAYATPSTQIWIPSTDIQPFGVFHLNIDSYFRASGTPMAPPVGQYGVGVATRDANFYDVGPTIGILPFEKIQMEVGFDYLTNANDPNDNRPFSGNFKLGTPEDSLFTYSPALAFGMYNIGKNPGNGNAPGVTSGQNILYFLAARTLPAMGPVPSLGRVSAGYYYGAKSALVAPMNAYQAAVVASGFGAPPSSNDGLLLSWDRTMTELTDKLWVGVDYFSGHNVNSSINFGASWAFSKNVSVIFGFDYWMEHAVAGNNTFTVQVDLNWP